MSDNESRFKSNSFNAFLTSFGIQYKYTAFYSPQANASERVNRSILAGIRSFIKQDHRQWYENLSFICYTLRNSLHQSFQMSTYHSLFGFDMITHVMVDEPANVVSRDDELQPIRQKIRKNMSKA